MKKQYCANDNIIYYRRREPSYKNNNCGLIISDKTSQYYIFRDSLELIKNSINIAINGNISFCENYFFHPQRLELLINHDDIGTGVSVPVLALISKIQDKINEKTI